MHIYNGFTYLFSTGTRTDIQVPCFLYQTDDFEKNSKHNLVLTQLVPM